MPVQVRSFYLTSLTLDDRHDVGRGQMVPSSVTFCKLCFLILKFGCNTINLLKGLLRLMKRYPRRKLLKSNYLLCFISYEKAKACLFPLLCLESILSLKIKFFLLTSNRYRRFLDMVQRGENPHHSVLKPYKAKHSG